MTELVAFALVGALAFALFGGAVFAAAAPRLKAGAFVMLIGDSLGAGLDAPLRSDLPSLRWESHTVTGATSSALNAYERIGIKSRKPAAVLLSFGTNDAAATDAEFIRTFPARARAIVTDLHSAGVQVYWLEPPPMPLGGYAAIVAGIRASGAFVLEAPGSLPRASDGVHVTPEGNQRWARAIAAAVGPS
jgi:lysophospholipase L1-like esterase